MGRNWCTITCFTCHISPIYNNAILLWSSALLFSTAFVTKDVFWIIRGSLRVSAILLNIPGGKNHEQHVGRNLGSVPHISCMQCKLVALHCLETVLLCVSELLHNGFSTAGGHSALIDILVVKRIGQITVVGCVTFLDCKHRQVFGRYSNWVGARRTTVRTLR